LLPAFDAGRLLILSPFPPKDKRITATRAQNRNRFVGALADRIFIPHAAPNSRTLAFANEMKKAGKEILPLFENSDNNAR
jgi:predicted Rossmann fold nucleotide-binding protein DprA/Smf involved in DNA uptake